MSSTIDPRLEGIRSTASREAVLFHAYLVRLRLKLLAIIHSMITVRRYLPKSTAELILWYERYISPLSLIAGFIVDNLILLRRVDLLRTNLLFFSYLLISGGGIVLLRAIESGRIRHPWALYLAPYIPVVVQFSFGGLFSGYLSLYSRSAGLIESWVFVVALALLLLGNERFLRLYSRFAFQVTLYFIVLFSFLIFFLPILLHSIGDTVFVASGVLSLSLIACYMVLLAGVGRETVRRDVVRASASVIGVYILFNALYFMNLIPPLPLALKDAGVYHNVVHENDGTYTLLAEKSPWFQPVFFYKETIHLPAAAPVFIFTSIFAPSGLSTPILHEWQFFDATSSTWLTKARINFYINGGRDGGYRGYSEKFNVTPGDWRVNVLTGSGRVIGRITFLVESATSTPGLVEEVQ